MAENKQYITQIQENGSVMISEDVIATIVLHAVSEVDGVVSISTKPGVDIAEVISKKNWGKGLKIAIAQTGDLTIDCNINIRYGQSVVGVATAVQEAISMAVESMTGAKIDAVNVNVHGIVRQ